VSRLVFLDAGHGGADTGIVVGDVSEKDIALPIALYVGEILEKRGYSVGYSRATNEDVTAQRRASLANDAIPSCFVSIHCNQAPSSPAIHGIETLYLKSDYRGAVLAKSVQAKVVAVVNAKNRLVRGVEGDAVLGAVKAPAVTVNVGFLSHDNERSLLDTQPYRLALASAIAEGIDAYLVGHP